MNESAFHQMATGMAAGMATSANDQQQIVEWMNHTDRKTYVYGYTDYLKFDVREDLKNIDVPVTILGAGKPYGAEIAKATYNKQYENLVDYELYINADSAHFIMMDQPQWFLNQLTTALEVNIVTETEFTTLYNNLHPKIYRLCLGYVAGDEVDGRRIVSASVYQGVEPSQIFQG